VNRTTVGERYQDYVDAVYALADARQNVAVFDLNKYLGASAGLLADHVHPNDSAHVAIAHGLFQILA
jgi:lysophospholipase L1-like esterase